jgi:hypothetical protein
MSDFQILFWLLIAAAVYFNWRLGKIQIAIVTLEAKKIDAPPMPTESRSGLLPYEWFDSEWPAIASDDDLKVSPPFENPRPHSLGDDYSTALLVSEYNGAAAPNEKKDFLRRMRRTSSIPWEIAEMAFTDGSSVRMWAAAHLDLIHKDYTGWTFQSGVEPKVICDFEEILSRDADPAVRAALFSNPNCSRKNPYTSYGAPADGWQRHFSSLLPLERLALMRNSDIRENFLLCSSVWEPGIP